MNYVKNTIGWADLTCNPIKGLCPMPCSYCYAKRYYHRFHLDPTIRLDMKELFAPVHRKKPARIFVGSTIDMYHPIIPRDWIHNIIAASWDAPQHTFLTLTKWPENLKSIEFPEWWWVGTTVNYFQDWIRLYQLRKAEASLKFISFEPLFEDLGDSTNFNLEGIDWVILGGESPKKFFPSEYWIKHIEDKADKLGIPVFEKSNLRRWKGPLRQEFPKGALKCS